MNKPKFFQSEFAAYLLVTYLVTCTYKILITWHWRRLIPLTDVAYWIIEGTPQWIAHQNRLLGPYLLLGISKLYWLEIGYIDSWKIYQAITLQILFVMIFWMMRREGMPKRESLAYLLCFSFVFLTFQDRWYFVWDNIDLIVFSAFSYGILTSRSNAYFTLLFLVAILNRESALFIPAFLVLNAFRFEPGRLAPKFRSAASLALGFFLMVGGMAYTKWVRHALFRIRADGLPDTEHELIGNHFNLFKNCADLFFYNLIGPKFYISVLLLGALAYFVSSWKRMNDRQFKCLLVMLLMFLNIMVFSIVNETRSHFMIFPVFLFLYLSVNRKFTERQQVAA